MSLDVLLFGAWIYADDVLLSLLKSSTPKVACQKTDWRRHKPECAPAEDVISNDVLWSSAGVRNGTKFLKFTRGTS